MRASCKAELGESPNWLQQREKREHCGHEAHHAPGVPLHGWHIVIRSVLTTTLGFQAQWAHLGTEKSEITIPWEATKT